MSLTRMPDNELARKKGWERMTAEDGLLVHLQQCVQQRADEATFQEMQADLAAWDVWQQEVQVRQRIIPSYPYQSNAARTLIRLAQLATCQPAPSVEQLLDQSDSSFDAAWRWDAFCALSGNPRRPLPGTEQSISVLLEQDEFGCLARLETELIADGTGQLYADPMVNAFLEFDAETFLAGAREVWDLVKRQFAELADQQQLATVDVRFRLISLPVPNYRNPQLHRISGRSAQLAFFLSLFQTAGARLGKSEALLLGDTIAASATIVPDNLLGVALGSVAALESKLEAAYLKGLAVVVVSKADEAAAQKALRDAWAHDKDDEVRPLKTEVVGLGTIAELLGFLRDRAKEREAVRRYEQEHCAKLKVVGRDDVDLATHYQELPLLRQVKRDRLPRDDRARDESGRQPGADKDDRFASLRGIELHRWEESLQQELFADKQFALDEVLTNFRKVIEAARSDVPRFFVLGPPGSGKTTLVQYLAWRAANHDLKLRGKHLLPARVSLRLWERSNAEAKCALPEYLAERYRSEKIPHPPTADHWRDWLRRGEVLLLLDGLDEINGDATFLEALAEALANYSECPTIITCRTVSFEQHRALTPDFPVFVLGALNTEQRDRSIRAYAAGRSFDADALITQLNRTPQMNSLAANPLLLSIICFVIEGQSNGSLPIKRSELYRKAVDKLLRQVRRIAVNYPGGTKEEPRDLPLTRKRHILERAALTLFVGLDQQRQLTIDEASLLRAFTDAAELEGYRADPATVADALLLDLAQNSGLLRGDEKRGYFFLHLTIQEYLAAAAIARTVNDKKDWEAIVQFSGISVTLRHFVDCIAWDPRYQEVTVLLAGQLKDPAPLLQLLADEKRDDGFRHRLALAALCLPELKSVKRVSQPLSTIINQVTTTAFFFWWERRNEWLGAWLSHLTKALPALGQVNGRVCNEVIDLALKAPMGRLITSSQDGVPLLDYLAELLRHEDKKVRHTAAEAVGRIGSAAATPDILDCLLEMLSDKSWSSMFGEPPVEAIAGIGNAAATSKVLIRLAELLHNKDEKVRIMAAKAVAGIGSAAAIPEILDNLAELLRDDDTTVQSYVVEAVKGIGCAAATPEFLGRLIRLLRDEEETHYTVVQVLNAIGSAAATPTMLACLSELLGNRRWITRLLARDAARFLKSAAATPEFLTRLAELMRNENEDVREDMAIAVRNIGSAAATGQILDGLIELLYDKSWSVRAKAAFAFRSVGGRDAPREVLDYLAKSLSNLGVCKDAARVVRNLGSAAATPEFLYQVAILLGDKSVIEDCIEAARKEVLDALPLVELIMAMSNIERNIDKEELTEILIRDFRLNVAQALADIGSAAATPEFLSCLVQLMCKGDEWGRCTAAEVVSGIGDAAATSQILDSLADLLEDEVANVRLCAAIAVASIGSKAATPRILGSLAKLLRDDSQCYRPQWGAVSSGSLRAVQAIGSDAATPPILDQFAEILRGGDTWKWEQVAKAVRNMGNAAATPKILYALIELLPKNHYPMSEGEEIAKAVGGMRITATMPVILAQLAELLDGKSYSYLAAVAIEGLMAQGFRLFQRQGGMWEAESVEELSQWEKN